MKRGGGAHEDGGHAVEVIFGFFHDFLKFYAFFHESSMAFLIFPWIVHWKIWTNLGKSGKIVGKIGKIIGKSRKSLGLPRFYDFSMDL